MTTQEAMLRVKKWAQLYGDWHDERATWETDAMPWNTKDDEALAIVEAALVAPPYPDRCYKWRGCPPEGDEILQRINKSAVEELERLAKENTQMRNSTAKEIICSRCGRETLFYAVMPYGSPDDGDTVCVECLNATDGKARAEKAEAELGDFAIYVRDYSNDHHVVARAKTILRDLNEKAKP